jgi:hypothetical protein
MATPGERLHIVEFRSGRVSSDPPPEFEELREWALASDVPKRGRRVLLIFDRDSRLWIRLPWYARHRKLVK